MKPKEIYLLFLEEALELFPLIQAGLEELAENYSQPEINSNTAPNTIGDILALLNALNSGITQVRDARGTNGKIPADLVNLDELQSLISHLHNLLLSFLEPTSKDRLLEFDELWQTYFRLKYYCLVNLSQLPSGNLGILAKGEALFSLATLQTYLATSGGLDKDLQTAIVHKDMVQSLAELKLILDSPNLAEQLTELKHQAEIFSGLGELLELKDLIAIAQSVTICLEANSPATQLITQRALACWQTVQTALSQDPNERAEDWRNYLFLLESDRTLISTGIIPEIKPKDVPHFSVERILQTDQFFMWLSGFNIFFLPANLVLAMVMPQTEQIKYINKQQIFLWQEQKIRLYQLYDLLNYNYLLPDDLSHHPSTLILVVQHNDNLIALEVGVEQPLVESSLTLKSCAPILTTPDYVCGCTLFGNDCLRVVIDVLTLLDRQVAR